MLLLAIIKLKQSICKSIYLSLPLFPSPLVHFPWFSTIGPRSSLHPMSWGERGGRGEIQIGRSIKIIANATRKSIPCVGSLQCKPTDIEEWIIPLSPEGKTPQGHVPTVSINAPHLPLLSLLSSNTPATIFKIGSETLSCSYQYTCMKSSAVSPRFPTCSLGRGMMPGTTST